MMCKTSAAVCSSVALLPCDCEHEHILLQELLLAFLFSSQDGKVPLHFCCRPCESGVLWLSGELKLDRCERSDPMDLWLL